MRKHITEKHYKKLEACKAECTGENKIIKKTWFPKRISFKKDADKLAAELRLMKNVTGSLVGNFLKKIEQLCKKKTSEFISETEAFFKYKDIDTEDPDIKAFLRQFVFTDSFSQYGYVAGQLTALKNNFSYIEPKEIFLGKKYSRQYNDTYQYISLKKTLEQVLSNDEVREYIDHNSNQSNDGFLRSYEDGEHFKSHTFYKKFPNALRISLYFDEFQGNNPLGPNTVKQKIGAFYFSILNLPPHLNYWMGNVMS